MKKNKFNFWELLVTIVIVLVIIHTFLEDFAFLSGWSDSIQKILMIAGFFFDLFFTIEFLVRLHDSRFRKGSIFYFVHERGWVDFFASIPLLMFNSGPQFITFFGSKFGIVGLGSLAGFLSMLKLIKTIRIARVLRLLRVVKIFKNIKYADSIMAQRHLAKIITISITVLVISLFIFATFIEAAGIIKASDLYAHQKNKVMTLVKKQNETKKDFTVTLSSLRTLSYAHNLIVLKINGKTKYSKYIQDVYNTVFTFNDYEYKKDGPFEFYFDIRDENMAISKNQAKDSLIFFFIVLLIVVSYLIFYSPHFAITVTDPIYVMKRGLEDIEYNLEVKIPEIYETDDVFQLGKLYNEKYLPLKDREMGDQEHSVIKMDMEIGDLNDLIEPGE